MKKKILAIICLVALCGVALVACNTSSRVLTFEDTSVENISVYGQEFSLSKVEQNIVFNYLESANWSCSHMENFTSPTFSNMTVYIVVNQKVVIHDSSEIDETCREIAKETTNWMIEINLNNGIAYLAPIYFSSFNGTLEATLSQSALKAIRSVFGYEGLPTPVPSYDYLLTIEDKGNFIYDKPTQNYFGAGEELTFHSYMLTDVDLGMYVNGELYSVQKSVKTDDGYVWEFNFTMPAENVTMQFKAISAEYYAIREIFSASSKITDQNVTKVRYEHRYSDAAPGSLRTIKYAESSQQISAAVAFLDSLAVKKNSVVIAPGCSCETLTYYLESDSGESSVFSVQIADGLLQFDGNYYEILSSIDVSDYGDELFAFTTYNDSYTVNKNGVVLGTFTGLSNFEFSDMVDTAVYEESGITLQTEFGVIELLINEEKTRFRFENAEYVLQNGDFSFAFDLVAQTSSSSEND